MIANDILQKIDDETDIVALVSEFVSLEKRGKTILVYAHFMMSQRLVFQLHPKKTKNIAMCMGCKEGGRPINFYRKIKNISFQEAAVELAGRIGIKLDVKERS